MWFEIFVSVQQSQLRPSPCRMSQISQYLARLRDNSVAALLQHQELIDTVFASMVHCLVAR